jgi:hypothetical protein
MLYACYICVLILLYMCQATCYVYGLSLCPHAAICMLYMCPHTVSGKLRGVSSYSYVCVLICVLNCSVSSYCYMCPHTPIYVSSYVSSYCYICVRILLYMCPHTVRQATRRAGRVGWRSGWLRLQRYDLQTHTRRQGVHCKCCVCARAHAKRPRCLHLAARQREKIEEGRTKRAKKRWGGGDEC